MTGFRHFAIGDRQLAQLQDLAAALDLGLAERDRRHAGAVLDQATMGALSREVGGCRCAGCVQGAHYVSLVLALLRPAAEGEALPPGQVWPPS